MVVRQAVHLVDEDLKENLRVDLVGLRDGRVQPRQRIHVIVLGVDDEHQRATAAENQLRVEGRVEEVNLAGKVPDLELHKGAVQNVCVRRTRPVSRARGWPRARAWPANGPSLTIWPVLSRNSVSFGDILWKTTF